MSARRKGGNENPPPLSFAILPGLQLQKDKELDRHVRLRSGSESLDLLLEGGFGGSGTPVYGVDVKFVNLWTLDTH